ncbi:MAG: hypothetical protein ACLFPD_04255 [Desulfosudaceae bacterium]
MRFFHPQECWRLLFPVRVLVGGLLLAQIIGTVLVWQSNHALLHKLNLLQAAGIYPLPGMGVSPPLSSLSAALAGGLFFALSIGAGVVLLTLGTFLLVTSLPAAARKYMILVLAAVWLGLLIRANWQGFCPGLTAFLVLVPGPVLWLCRRQARRFASTERPGRARLFHLLLILFLCVWWGLRINSQVFVNIKDNLLLTSGAGRAFVHLYYQYTLYPAEVFKTLAQKQVKTCRLAGFAETDLPDRVKKALATHDYFAVEDPLAEVTVRRQDGQLFLGCRQDMVVKVPTARFLDDPGGTLRRLSAGCDVNAAFRDFTLAALLGVAPLVLYLATLTMFALVPGLFLPLRLSAWLVPLLCCLLWAGVIPLLDSPPLRTDDGAAAAAAMTDGSRKEKIAALRYVFDRRLDIFRFPGYAALRESEDFALRYWLIRNLGHSRNPRADRQIRRFLAADSPYLVCKAMEAAAARAELFPRTADQGLKEAVVEKLSVSDNWYVQMYAYRTARRLGWMPVKFD